MLGPDGAAAALTDLWYGEELPGVTEKLESRIPAALFKVTRRFPPIRALVLLWTGRRYPLLLTCWDATGRWVTLICGVIGLKKLVILEFIDFNYESKHPFVARSYELLIKKVLGPCARRAFLNVQVFTEWEKEYVEVLYGIDKRRVRLFSWPLSHGKIGTRSPDADPKTPMVFSSGRAACDWETLFEAFHNGNWPLTVVCSAKDLSRVKLLNQSNKATVLAEVSRDVHDKLFETATVYALCLVEKQKSSGQVRLANCIDAGVPVVAANVRGLQGYLINGVTAMAYSAGDAKELGQIIEDLLRNEQKREELVVAAQEFASGHTREKYMRNISEMLLDSVIERNSMRSHQ
jgi:hypothetical protein